ncbi:MAG: Na+/H+ antiporter subunit E [Longimicrobiales bacterium]|nr:Na+/H+ antiporter subunit E [Longimicrobiales bacterium]
MTDDARNAAPPPPRGGPLPHPVLSVILFVTWVLLAGRVAPSTLVMAAALALAVPFFTRRFWPERPHVRRWGALLRFIPIFLWDVLVANLEVAWLIVNLRRTIRPRWIVIPLELTDPHAITTLANVISLTPGTVSSEIGPERKTLLVHSLDVPDPHEAVAFIKRRYEAPIREIFE